MFKVKYHDLLGRVGHLRTRRGTLETPAFLPIVNIFKQVVSPKELYEMGFKSIITNAYILFKRVREEAEERGVHEILQYPGVVMTDSGAYQLLVYGSIEATPIEMVEFQQKIGSDVAIILDVPTGLEANRLEAERTVEETLRRAYDLFKEERKSPCLWVGPVQGGIWLDLVEKSSKEMAKLPFHVYALGSPTKVMGHYRFDVLVDMIMKAKTNLPTSKPFHLFGAGHPRFSR